MLSSFNINFIVNCLSAIMKILVYLEAAGTALSLLLVVELFIEESGESSHQCSLPIKYCHNASDKNSANIAINEKN